MSIRTTVAAASLLTAIAHAQDEAVAVQGTLSLDLPSAYFFRGMQQEDQGLIVQPAMELQWALYRPDDGGALGPIDLHFGTWNSFHRGPTGSDGAGDAWYEADLFAGVSIGFAERFALGAQWARFGSPNSTWSAMEETTLTLGFDDHDLLGEGFAGLQPSLLVAIETQGQGDLGARRGTYLQIGIEPSITLGGGDASEDATPITLSFPLAVGLSLGDYYERPSDGRDSSFGFVDLGAVISAPLGFLPGAWEGNLGVHLLFLGDATREMNGGDGTQPIVSLGFSTAF